MAAAPDGTIYVADRGNHRIQRFTATGQFLGTWGSYGSTDGQFAYPRDVAVAPDGTVYVADTDRIQVFGTAYPATWRGEYFANRWLVEAPVLIRQDAAIDFNWGTGSPGSGVPSDNFSARWQRYVWFEADTYRFTVFADDGVRLWVDHRLLIEQWQDQSATYSADISLSEGYHRVRLEYYVGSGSAAIQLSWQSSTTPTPTPTGTPTSTPTATPTATPTSTSTPTATPTATATPASTPTPTPTSTRPTLSIYLPLILKNYPVVIPTPTPTPTPTSEGQPNLSTSTKTVAQPTAQPGDSLLYTIVLNNIGAVNANVFITDAIPPHTAYVSGSVTGDGAYNAALDQIEWAGTVPVGVPVAITFQVIVNAETPVGTVIVNAAVVDDGVNPPFARTATTVVTVSSH